MTPEEKAKELVEKYREHSQYWDCSNDEPLKENHTKHSALICVDEIIEGINMLDIEYNQDQSSGHILDFYREVKQEIEKI